MSEKLNKENSFEKVLGRYSELNPLTPNNANPNKIDSPNYTDGNHEIAPMYLPEFRDFFGDTRRGVDPKVLHSLGILSPVDASLLPHISFADAVDRAKDALNAAMPTPSDSQTGYYTKGMRVAGLREAYENAQPFVPPVNDEVKPPVIRIYGESNKTTDK